jgi:hypothetical protein
MVDRRSSTSARITKRRVSIVGSMSPGQSRTGLTDVIKLDPPVAPLADH